MAVSRNYRHGHLLFMVVSNFILRQFLKLISVTGNWNSEIFEQICGMEKNQANEIILYQPDDTLALDVRVEDESVWLTQAQMAELFQTSRNNITLHTRNIFKEGELIENSVSKDSLLTAKDGKKYRTKLYPACKVALVFWCLLPQNKLPVFRHSLRRKMA